MEWNIEISFNAIEEGDEIELAKIEALRAIAEQLETLNKNLKGMRNDNLF